MLQLFGWNPCQNRRVCDLVTIQVKYWKHRAVADRIEKFVRVPARSQRPCLRFTIAHYHSHNQIGIIERRSKPMRQAVSQLASFVDRTRSLRCAMAPDPAGERKLFEELLHPHQILALVRIDL